MTSEAQVVHLLDYGAGNVRSVRNAIREAGFKVVDIKEASEIQHAEALIFPGVGNFRQAMKFLSQNGYAEALTDYIKADKHFLGICLGLQTLFESSEECPDAKGLGIIPGTVQHFPLDAGASVPHIGWNGLRVLKDSPLFKDLEDPRVYFVHTYRALKTDENEDWILSTTNHGSDEFVSSIQKGNVMATQFHPEKSGRVGISIIRAFLESIGTPHEFKPLVDPVGPPTVLAKRVIACLDVRTNDDGDLVVTKGDQYDVRDSTEGQVRNLGQPVALCARYYEEGADEIAFLNICSFREEPLGDLPMIQVLERASERVFVPLTIGGGIRGYTDTSGKVWSALDVAAQYFRAGADKVSIGSDAVLAAEEYFKQGKTGKSAIELISEVYGKQAVVVSLDPRRVYVSESSESIAHSVVQLEKPGPNKETHCWYQATIRGGREGRDIDAIQVAIAAEALGAGEILLNCVDMDGQKDGYDHDLIRAIKSNVSIPVIASSGAGCPVHFSKVFQ